MIVYFDTSALIPLLVDEPGTTIASALWTSAEARISARVVHVEAAAALGLAHRLGRLRSRQLSAALRSLTTLVDHLDIVEITAELTTRAASLAISQKLRGYDAIHCAAGVSLASERSVAATGDGDLRAAWQRLGLATADTSSAVDTRA